MYHLAKWSTVGKIDASYPINGLSWGKSMPHIPSTNIMLKILALNQLT